jgi:PKD repeat protein
MSGMKKSTSLSVLRHRREHGFTLLEALIALAILGFAIFAIIAFQGGVLGSAADNRLRSIATTLAEQKLEQLRAARFDSAELDAGSGSELLTVPNFFRLFASDAISLRRCWTITDELDADGDPVLKRVQVAVSREGATCAPWGAGTLVTLTSRIARNDFGRAGAKSLIDTLFNPDGEGQLVPLPSGDPLPVQPAGVPPGFLAYEYTGPDPTNKPWVNPSYMLCDPVSQFCLAPTVDGQPLKFATINGNIFLSGRSCAGSSGTLGERCGLLMAIEGNGICRTDYPGFDPAPGSPTAAPEIPSGGGASGLSYIRYSCVVADQWRRSITVLPNDRINEKVCVGNPALILATGDPGDQLRATTRFYDGRAPGTEGVLEVPYGLRGVAAGANPDAVIGTVCTEGPCLADTSVNGLVPGGHHFMVMPTNAGKCSARFAELPLIDQSAGTYYRHLFARNPDQFYCTSSKNYGGEFCTNYTRISGFIENDASETVSSDDIDLVATGGGLFEPCKFFGALGDAGGAYVCGVLHGSTAARVRGAPKDPLFEFAPSDGYEFTKAAGGTGDAEYLPIVFPLDATARNFELRDALRPPVAAFTADCVDTVCTFNATASSGGDGMIVTYVWSFGDGNLAAGASVTHTYAAYGAFTVRLTVTSDIGLQDNVAQVVTLLGDGNQAPVPSFTVSCDGLSCSFDASASTDDGTIVTYAWDFGDGTTVEGVTATHDFATPGSFTVTLTVTDNDGVSVTRSETINVSAPVSTTTCNIVATGQKHNRNATATVSYAGAPWRTCADVGTDNYRCEVSNALEGESVRVRSTQGGKDLLHTFIVNCASPTVVYDFPKN